MNLKDYRETYYTYTAKASDISRQLSFAGIAFIWIFKTTSGGLLSVPTMLQLAGVLFALTLAADLLQYIYGSIFWGGFARYYEIKETKDDDELDAPTWANWPTLFFFWGKLLLLFSGYIFVVLYIFSLLAKTS
ncbi:MAG: hypothetical protein C4516_05810 [Oxalobacter sp.]|nr:MAG: hypothetical protein C4516_05810 [Oxalobacter sp.]